MINTQHNFNVPIPGESLTAELGARPWQTPPEIATVDQAISYYMNKMSTDDFSIQLIDVMEMGVPLTDIANIIQLGAVTEGVHSVDVGMMVMPGLIEMMMLIGDSAGVEYISGLGETGTEDISPTLPLSIAKKLKDKNRNKKIEEPAATPEPEPIEEEEPKGLMARRNKRG